MSAKKRKRAAEIAAPIVQVYRPETLKPQLKAIGGSQSDQWNNSLANATLQTLWLKHANEETQNKQFEAALAGLIGIAPQDELEGMMAAQLLAAHFASMECYRRAMLGEQTFEGRRENLAQANKLSRTFTMLLQAMDRHRGKGQQKVVVEHVHVHAGGQAIVGNVGRPGGGDQSKLQDQAHAKQITHAPQPEMRGKNSERENLPVTGHEERPLQDARRHVARSPDGKPECV